MIEVYLHVWEVVKLTDLFSTPYAEGRVKSESEREECAVYQACCVSFNLRKSSQVVSRIYAKEMHDSPVRGPLFALMMIISKRGPATITALAEDVGLDRTTLTRNLKPLEQRGLIRIQQVSSNRKEVSLLPEGELALRCAMESWRRAQAKVVNELGEERWSRMRDDLAAVMALGQ
jgi:DNA-binding MarR family transcriptional regulator